YLGYFSYRIYFATYNPYRS
ncbi:hypothetical protein G210_5221, partial [Candida maltosa Xu316]